LPQLQDSDEIIISDDNSQDDTLNIIASFDDSRIKVYKDNTFHSPIFNFENTLKHVNGDIIVLADQDDIWDSNKLSTIKKSFRNKNQKYSLKMYNGRCINEKDEVIKEDLFMYLNVKKGLVNNIVKNSFIGCNIAFTKDLLEVVLPFPKDIPMHDSWLACNAYLYGDVEFVNSKVFNYRIHENNYSIKNTTLFQKLQWRVNLIKNLITRYVYVKFST
jgi:glycosyltransferase involved in cell wall biosynthesis